MIGRLTPRRLLSIGALTALWCALWGAATPANALSGLVLSTMVIAIDAGNLSLGSIRVRSLVRLLAIVVVDLTKSTVEVAHEILTPTDYTDESVVAVTLPPESDNHLLFLVVAITLTPGTAVVDVDPDNNRIFLHLLHDARRDDVVAHVDRLAELACDAFPARVVASP